MLEKFIEQLAELKPEMKVLIAEGYSENYINDIINEFTLRKINSIQVSSKINDFLYNFDIQHFRVLNLFFTNEIDEDTIEDHFIFGFIEGGYISFEKSTGYFYTSYADEIENSLNIICENEDQFFQILLIVAEFSSKAYENTDNLEKIKYIEMCQKIYSKGFFDQLFD
jgi:hypothetical protein